MHDKRVCDQAGMAVACDQARLVLQWHVTRLVLQWHATLMIHFVTRSILPLTRDLDSSVHIKLKTLNTFNEPCHVGTREICPSLDPKSFISQLCTSH